MHVHKCLDVSSTSSDQQQRRPKDRKNSAGRAVPPADDLLWNKGGAIGQSSKLEHRPTDTEIWQQQCTVEPHYIEFHGTAAICSMYPKFDIHV